MPELPEVETVKEILKKQIIGKNIKDIIIRKDNFIQELSTKEFKKSLINKTIKDIKRRGKFILFYLDDIVLISHLRMEGKYYLKNSNVSYEKHEHIIFNFTDNTDLRYHDTRRFGTYHIRKIGNEFNVNPLKKLGVEPLSEDLNKEYIKAQIKNKKGNIKQFLLNQEIISGLGNIYVDEVIFRMKVHPEKLVNTLNDNQIDLLVEAVKSVLSKAIKLGGTTIRSYTSSLGVTGRFQNELMIHMREGQACYVCGNQIKKIRVAQRGTYVCETCQKY